MVWVREPSIVLPALKKISQRKRVAEAGSLGLIGSLAVSAVFYQVDAPWAHTAFGACVYAGMISGFVAFTAASINLKVACPRCGKRYCTTESRSAANASAKKCLNCHLRLDGSNLHE